ncbi:hypothetical protein [Paenibacillus sp. ISL-20]|uniref:hypothetical protein n=1 Tax=Paenibacillus sp. ISL-20 TaxID=2819163 RepID=UPI001BEB7795|nr:hypothetical protein [Paenibacillus sp. ISL-20]MBT2759965.1 hypothetical protein [Paenibacillus sp. ISL-20]
MNKISEKELMEIENELENYWNLELIDIDQANRIAINCSKLLESLKIAEHTLQEISHTYNMEGTDLQVARKMVKLADSYFLGIDIKKNCSFIKF